MTDELELEYEFVPEEERLEVDEGEYSNALSGGDDTDGLDYIYESPGEIVDIEALEEGE